MTKGIRNTIIIMAIILCIFVIIFVVYQNLKTEPMDANATDEGNILDDPNTGLENMLNEIFNEEVANIEQNEIEEDDKIENTTNTINNTTTNNNSSNATQKQDEEELTENDNTMTPRETKAINLVKTLWEKERGSLKDVSFNVSIQSDGKYGVTVYDATTTKSIQFYIVDVDTEIVKER